MAPPRAACQILSTALSTEAALLKLLMDIQSAVVDICTIKGKLRFGIIDLADAIGAELISAIESTAETMAKSIASSASNAASAIIEAILSEILKILLSFPTAIFSLVAIPHQEALEATQNERMYLSKANANLSNAIRIILKWTNGLNGTDYYAQMQKALPFINKAVELMNKMVIDLQGFNIDSPNAGPRDSTFNEATFNALKTQLKIAIDITTPQSIIDNNAQISKAAAISKNARYKKYSSEIESKYQKILDELHKKFFTDLAAANSDGTSLKTSLKFEAIHYEYNIKKKAIVTSKKEELALAEIRAASEASVDKDAYTKSINNLTGQFHKDVKRLGDSLSDFLTNIKNAYLQNQLSQTYCNTCYASRTYIRVLINEMITVLRGIGNGAADYALNIFNTAKPMVDLTQEKFGSAVERYVDPTQRISSSEMSTTIVAGHGLLMSAHAIITGMVTDSLEKLINSDDVLQDADGQYEKFLVTLAKIPDWDGKLSVWSVNQVIAAQPPYVQLILDATTMLAKVPALGLSNNQDDRDQVKILINRVRKDYLNLKNHNSIVLNALSSYTPYMSAEAGNLKRILANAGLLQQFATGMSIINIATQLVMESMPNAGLTEFPTIDNCKKAYKDLKFGDLEAGADVKKQFDRPYPINEKMQSNIERKELDVLALRYIVQGDDALGISDKEESDLLNGGKVVDLINNKKVGR